MKPEPMITVDYLTSIGMENKEAAELLAKKAYKKQLKGDFGTIESARMWAWTTALVFIQIGDAIDSEGRVLKNPIEIKFPKLGGIK